MEKIVSRKTRERAVRGQKRSKRLARVLPFYIPLRHRPPLCHECGNESGWRFVDQRLVERCQCFKQLMEHAA
jgi:hypothetical protein